MTKILSTYFFILAIIDDTFYFTQLHKFFRLIIDQYEMEIHFSQLYYSWINYLYEIISFYT